MILEQSEMGLVVPLESSLTISNKGENMVEKKSFNQKAFEKVAMMKQDKEFKLIFAKSQSGKRQLIFCLKGEGENITPLCKILSKRDLDGLEPLFKETEEFELNQKFEKFLLSLKGWEKFTKSDWDNLDQNPNCELPY
tara:strand:+ start:69 stop:482 length:414 start_codon:yes stop_codon:yes gene_type:complete